MTLRLRCPVSWRNRSPGPRRCNRHHPDHLARELDDDTHVKELHLQALGPLAYALLVASITSVTSSLFRRAMPDHDRGLVAPA